VAPLLVAVAFDATGSYDETYVVFAICCLAAALGFVFSRPRVEAQQAAPVMSP
jgi:cyanate permease